MEISAAIIIAMGMLVDNAIVVFESALIRMQSGVPKRKAVLQAVSSTALPLLAATVIAIMTFMPIYFSPHITGEFMSTLETLDPVEGGMLLDEHEYDLASAKSTRPSDVHLHEALHNLDVGPPSNPETRCV